MLPTTSDWVHWSDTEIPEDWPGQPACGEFFRPDGLPVGCTRYTVRSLSLAALQALPDSADERVPGLLTAGLAAIDGAVVSGTDLEDLPAFVQGPLCELISAVARGVPFGQRWRSAPVSTASPAPAPLPEPTT